MNLRRRHRSTVCRSRLADVAEGAYIGLCIACVLFWVWVMFL